jgi:putative membrane protein
MKKTILMVMMCLAFIVAKAQIPQPDPDTTTKHFLTVSSVGNLQEVSAGQLAVQKARRADVRSFGQMMVKDHGQAEQQLLQLAKGQHLALPAVATGGVQPDVNLKNAGDNFDRVYVHAMVNGHRNTVQTFENYATTGKNRAAKIFAQQMLPTLKAHLNAIIEIEKQLNTK